MSAWFHLPHAPRLKLNWWISVDPLMNARLTMWSSKNDEENVEIHKDNVNSRRNQQEIIKEERWKYAIEKRLWDSYNHDSVDSREHLVKWDSPVRLILHHRKQCKIDS